MYCASVYVYWWMHSIVMTCWIFLLEVSCSDLCLSSLFQRDRMMLLKLEQDILEFINDDKWVSVLIICTTVPPSDCTTSLVSHMYLLQICQLPCSDWSFFFSTIHIKPTLLDISYKVWPLMGAQCQQQYFNNIVQFNHSLVRTRSLTIIYIYNIKMHTMIIMTSIYETIVL